MRGYFGIAIVNSKFESNLGSLIRTADVAGAKFVAVIGRRYKHQCTDTLKSVRRLPLFEYDTFEQFVANLPKGCKMIGIEMTDKAVDLANWR